MSEMMLSDAFLEPQPIHRLFASLCLVFVIYKVTTLFAKKRNALKRFEAFPGPPAHWLFGNILEVLYEEFTNFKTDFKVSIKLFI